MKPQSTAKQVQILRNLRSKISEAQIARTTGRFYGTKNYVLCFDAVHEYEDGGTSCEYTWYIPSDFSGQEPFEGSLVLVENLDDVAQVRVTRNVYTKTIEEHVNDVHPYCALVRVIEL